MNENAAAKMIRVAVVDKSPLVRAALEHLISEDPRFEFVAVSADGEELLRNIEQTVPNVIVSGWVMALGDGKYILDHLQTIEAAPQVIIYTGAEGDFIPSLVMAHGGAAYVSKSEEPQELLDTIAAVGNGKMVFPYLDVKQINDNPLTDLTKREVEVLSSLAAGRTNKEIAQELSVSNNTVKFHVRNLYQKLNVKNRSQAVSLYHKS
ncbi:MAG: response regulator transcription factor [Rhodospirillaceae bacterium]|jgi:DNA-binding NarL/FixJ family response regulator|nr:response regulator transcription factor [Rhodospirillaceae bacterium]MBT5939690.1 response regulator transcription factor [Rhodospirillaceae bacterium]MBT7267273.1 response regulator transcription factor [Rhodospirillaceae bacterium]